MIAWWLILSATNYRVCQQIAYWEGVQRTCIQMHSICTVPMHAHQIGSCNVREYCLYDSGHMQCTHTMEMKYIHKAHAPTHYSQPLHNGLGWTHSFMLSMLTHSLTLIHSFIDSKIWNVLTGMHCTACLASPCLNKRRVEYCRKRK